MSTETKGIRKFKKGQRVTADMGAGPQGGVIVGSWAFGHMVKFDRRPPREFNMGENPTALFDSWLRHAE